MRKEQALKFLANRDKVRIELPLSGRERQFKDKGKEIIQQFIASLGDNITQEGGTEWQFGKLSVIVYIKY